MAKSTSTYSKYKKKIWRFYILGLGLIVLLFTLISLGLFGFMPSFEELENPRSNLATEIYSSDQVLLGKYYLENRSNVKYNDLAPDLVDALIATEDSRFQRHSGVDVTGLMTAIYRTIFKGSRSGASTISQQLAKNLFPRGNRNLLGTIIMKFKEWVVAIKLERNYTKNEILAMYLNTVDFGSQSFGIKSAAKTYFNTTPADLKIEEAATLVGMLKAPSWYHPYRNQERSKQRRNVVLSQMKRYEYITAVEYDSLKVIELDVSNYKVQNHNTGAATYFREYLRSYLRDWAKNNYKPNGESYNIYKDGLRVYTTIDSRMQKYAEKAISDHLGKDLQPKFFQHWKGHKKAPFWNVTDKEIESFMESAKRRSERYRKLKNANVSKKKINESFNTPVKMKIFSWEGEIDTVLTPMDSIRYYKHFLRAGMMSMDPQTGFVKAYVGGINHKHFKYDQVMSARRQVGSTFKPFVYALALQELGYSPCHEVPNIPVTFETRGQPDWTPKNSSKYKSMEMVNLKDALANSINWVSAYLMKRLSPEGVINLTRKLGISSDIPEVPAICLGTPDLSVYEMVGAMSAFANKGVYIRPIFITRIEDKNGNIIQSFIPQKNEAVSEETAYLVLSLMKGVSQYGTGVRLRYKYQFTQPIAGKTGTTDNNSDGWFMGITPDLVTGAWVGCEDRAAHFRSTALGQGANTGLPIWALYMKKVWADKELKISQGDFEKPDFNISVETNCEKFYEEEGKPIEENIDFGRR